VRRESVSSSLVIDASAAVDFLLSRGDEADWVGAIIAGSDALVAPHLIDFDAAYIALAERLQLPLITTDRRLAGCSGHRADVVAFST
jgi:predicted nucleic acid-binding protein